MRAPSSETQSRARLLQRVPGHLCEKYRAPVFGRGDTVHLRALRWGGWRVARQEEGPWFAVGDVPGLPRAVTKDVVRRVEDGRVDLRGHPVSFRNPAPLDQLSEWKNEDNRGTWRKLVLGPAALALVGTYAHHMYASPFVSGKWRAASVAAHAALVLGSVAANLAEGAPPLNLLVAPAAAEWAALAALALLAAANLRRVLRYAAPSTFGALAYWLPLFWVVAANAFVPSALVASLFVLLHLLATEVRVLLSPRTRQRTLPAAFGLTVMHSIVSFYGDRFRGALSVEGLLAAFGRNGFTASVLGYLALTLRNGATMRRRFVSGDVRAMTSGRVVAAWEDAEGRLWFATDAEVKAFDTGETRTRLAHPNLYADGRGFRYGKHDWRVEGNRVGGVKLPEAPEFERTEFCPGGPQAFVFGAGGELLHSVHGGEATAHQGEAWDRRLVGFNGVALLRGSSATYLSGGATFEYRWSEAFRVHGASLYDPQDAPDGPALLLGGSVDGRPACLVVGLAQNRERDEWRGEEGRVEQAERMPGFCVLRVASGGASRYVRWDGRRTEELKAVGAETQLVAFKTRTGGTRCLGYTVDDAVRLLVGYHGSSDVVETDSSAVLKAATVARIAIFAFKVVQEAQRGAEALFEQGGGDGSGEVAWPELRRKLRRDKQLTHALDLGRFEEATELLDDTKALDFRTARAMPREWCGGASEACCEEPPCAWRDTLRREAEKDRRRLYLQTYLAVLRYAPPTRVVHIGDVSEADFAAAQGKVARANRLLVANNVLGTPVAAPALKGTGFASRRTGSRFEAVPARRLGVGAKIEGACEGAAYMFRTPRVAVHDDTDAETGLLVFAPDGASGDSCAASAAGREPPQPPPDPLCGNPRYAVVLRSLSGAESDPVWLRGDVDNGFGLFTTYGDETCELVYAEGRYAWRCWAEADQGLTAQEQTPQTPRPPPPPPSGAARSARSAAAEA